ncbi:nucleotidyltransferase family protein [Allorhizobium taibaishanense]|uniref:Molybdenum cofactor cytidylyltransferase n=1 Tax=Allorhizobium taibaishanense TaxID=887144 RepID=A0A1Q9A6K5_9HYPH|nr:nucleotidyltransferase family protein [Allorhizobium taibaishanense]MBB4008666.1 molybdenum cofactor cytidylyltransferase [Allorhizobium taibaishanense]OLP50201.1 molybdopterin-guanine dinucleotide biosynthesis protein MobA [Allorhizobium taibaishanense]
MPDPKTLHTAILILAAGRASRMGEGTHKLLAEFQGVPLVRRVAGSAVASRAAAVTVVTGHRRAEIEACLSDLPVDVCFNSAYAEGMATSLVAGLQTTGRMEIDGIMVVLADMPDLTSAHFDRLMAAFEEAGGDAVIRAASNGQPGNPVILPRQLYPELLQLKGDRGAKSVIMDSSLPIIDVEIGPAALVDVDTPDAVVAAGGILKR